jgi:PhzF family phenazine biosynthesis protein
MKTYRVYQIDAFTRERFKGNPAGVVPDADGLTDSQMQAIAREMNNAETAFILSATAANHEVWVRFFTPTTEVPSCGHATISAHYVRAIEEELPTCTVLQRIGIGILPVDVVKEGGDYKIIMTQGAIEISEEIGDQTQDDILGALGLGDGDTDERFPIKIASTGHSKVMVGIRSRAKLNSLAPDLTKLTNISGVIGCNGYFVFTFDSDDSEILSHGRMFAPAIGIPEDPVTGNANGPLGAYLVHHGILKATGGIASFKGKQGEAIGRPGIVEVTVEVEDGRATKVKVGGHATVAFKTEIKV